jgi:hypothetical protein
MATERQIAANRLNAMKSTGPNTFEGKLASRGNAITHGLTGAGVALPEDEANAVLDRRLAWGQTLGPRNEHESWLVEQAALESIRIDRCQDADRALRVRLADRARTCWDDDRRLAAEGLVDKITRRPALVRRQLEATSQGCDVLIERWTGLEKGIDAPESWTDTDRSRALDLLGIPAEGRATSPLGDTPSDLRDLVAREIDRLRALKSGSRDRLDADDARLAALGHEVEPDRALALVRRYESASRRRLEWALKQLKDLRGGRPIEPIHYQTTRPADHARPSSAAPRFEFPTETPTPLPEPPLPLETPESTDLATLTAPAPVSRPSSVVPAQPPAMNRRQRLAQLALARRS